MVYDLTIPKKMRVLQINLKCCYATHGMLEITARELNIDIILASEYNQDVILNNALWITDRKRDVAVKVRNNHANIKIIEHDGLLGVEVEKVLYMSCYVSPNISTESYGNYVTRLDNVLKQIGKKKVVVAGNFNAKSHL